MSSKEIQGPLPVKRRLLGAHPAIVLGIFLSILALSFGDTLEIIPIFAPLVASPFFQFFHEIHDLLALGVALYSAYKHTSRLGAVGILLYLAAHVPYAIIRFPDNVMELLHTLVTTFAALFGIWLIRQLYKSEEQRKASQKILHQSEERYQDLYDNAPAAYYSVGVDGLVKESNIAAQLLFGYSKEELIGKHRLELYAPENSAKANLLFEKFKSGIPVENEEMVYLTKDGRKIHGLLSASPIVDEKGQVILSRSVVRDINKVKQMQEQLMAQDRLVSIGQLVAGVAHEINNPLTSVIGFSDLLFQRDLPDDVKDDLKIVHDEAQRASRIVKNLLTFTRKQPERKTEIQVNEQIQRVLDLRSHEQKVSNIQVNVHFAPDLPQIIGNGSQLQQVFFNIITNAEQAMLETNGRGVITVTTEQLGDIVKVRLADDGPGISPENMMKLFTPFFTTKGVGKGTGLGLSICYGIVTEHDGRIYAESEPGKGAAFIVELPVKQATTS